LSGKTILGCTQCNERVTTFWFTTTIQDETLMLIEEGIILEEELSIT
jgi:hypothetical protein